MFKQQHKNDEFFVSRTQQKDKQRDADYKYALKFRKEYLRNVLRIAKLWNIKLMNEEDLPPHRKNVIRCEDNGSAFIDLKKRLFF